MSGTRLITKDGSFTPWPRESGPGFSFREGDLRGELEPAKDSDGLVSWMGVLWHGDAKGTPLAVVWAPTHWEGASALRDAAKEAL